MKPYYRRKGVSLYLGESLGILPTLNGESFDALITDPPYSSGGRTIAAKSADPLTKYQQTSCKLDRASFSGDSKDQRSFIAWSITWMNQARKLMKDGAYSLVFTDWRQLPSTTDAIQGADFTWRGVIAWDKGLASRAPHKGYIRHQCEYVVWARVDDARTATMPARSPGAFVPRSNRTTSFISSASRRP